MKTVTTSIIRQRGQLTIPDSLRKQLNWATPLSPVSITIEKPNKIVITPHIVQSNVNWDAVWLMLKRARSIKGTGQISGAEFLVDDRQRH